MTGSKRWKWPFSQLSLQSRSHVQPAVRRAQTRSRWMNCRQHRGLNYVIMRDIDCHGRRTLLCSLYVILHRIGNQLSCKKPAIRWSVVSAEKLALSGIPYPLEWDERRYRQTSQRTITISQSGRKLSQDEPCRRSWRNRHSWKKQTADRFATCCFVDSSEFTITPRSRDTYTDRIESIQTAWFRFCPVIFWRLAQDSNHAISVFAALNCRRREAYISSAGRDADGRLIRSMGASVSSANSGMRMWCRSNRQARSSA